jgi:hypothetical protein
MSGLLQLVKRLNMFAPGAEDFQKKRVFLHIPAGLDDDGMARVRRVTGDDNVKVPCKISIEITFKEDTGDGEFRILAVDFLQTQLYSTFQGEWTKAIKQWLFTATRGSMDLTLLRVYGEKLYLTASGNPSIELPFRAPGL